jgi:hypothetical protein
MKRTYKRLLKLVAVLIIIFLLDKLTGIILGHLYQTSTNDAIYKIRYSFTQTNEDILIFGPSRAQHHYIPDTLTKGTKLKAYNCGLGGQPIAFSLVQISETLKRYNPKIIILDIPPDISLARDPDPRLSVLNPYFHKDTLVRQVLLNNSSRFEKLKFIFSTYPYNGMIAEIILSLVYDPKVSVKGFIPIYGSKTDDDEIRREGTDPLKEIPAIQLEYLQRITELCQRNNVNLWLVISPLYNITQQEKKTIQDLKDYANKNNVRLMDFSKSWAFNDNILFRDNLHLNIDGAIKFTAMVRDSILNYTNYSACR